MKITKLKHLAHSGQGENAIHNKVIDAFNTSFAVGLQFCKDKGYTVEFASGHITITQNCEYGFKMIASTEQLLGYDAKTLVDMENGMLFDRVTFEHVGTHNT